MEAIKVSRMVLVREIIPTQQDNGLPNMNITGKVNIKSLIFRKLYMLLNDSSTHHWCAFNLQMYHLDECRIRLHYIIQIFNAIDCI